MFESLFTQKQATITPPKTGIFNGLFVNKPASPQNTKQPTGIFSGLFNNKKTETPTQPMPTKTAKLPTFLGGGQYNVGDQGSLTTTSRDYAGIEAPGQYREHIFPVALGGTSSFDNIKVYGKDLGAKKAAYEKEIIKQYKSKKISLPEARGLVLKKYRELTGLDPKQGKMANLLPAIGEMITNPLDTLKKVGNVLIRNNPEAIKEVGKTISKLLPNQESLKVAYEQAKPSVKNGIDLPRLTNVGIITKLPNGKYSSIDPTMMVGAMKNVAKEGLDTIGKTLLSNIKNFNPEKYVAEQVVKQEVARVAEQPGVLGSIRNFYKEVKTKLVDSNAPIEDVLNKTLKENKITLKPTEHITNQIDRVLRAPTIAGQFAKDNGIVDVIKNVDNLTHLDQYMIAKQARAVEANGIKTGRNLAKDELLINAHIQGRSATKAEATSRGVL
jgi:hypothetical protein